jgi:predicted RNase H-like HicB family nuclease
VYAVGNTRDEAEGEIRTALALHLDELARSGQPWPESRSVVGEVTVKH